MCSSDLGDLKGGEGTSEDDEGGQTGDNDGTPEAAECCSCYALAEPGQGLSLSFVVTLFVRGCKVVASHLL